MAKMTPAPSLAAVKKEVLTLIAQGYRSSDIAEEPVISPSTVNTHRGNIMTKLGLSTPPGVGTLRAAARLPTRFIRIP